MNSTTAIIVASDNIKKAAETDPNLLPVIKGLEVALKKVKLYDKFIQDFFVPEDDTPYVGPYFKKIMEKDNGKNNK